MTIPGPTFEPDHLTDLVELHEISVTVPRHVTEEDRREIWSICGDRAQDWATATGVEILIEYFADSPVTEHEETNAAGAVCGVTLYESWTVGVRWKIIVGRGTSAVPGSGYQELMSGQHWVWSERWKHWRSWFQSMIRNTELRTSRGGYLPVSSAWKASLFDNLAQANQSGHPTVSAGQRFLTDHDFTPSVRPAGGGIGSIPPDQVIVTLGDPRRPVNGGSVMPFPMIKPEPHDYSQVHDSVYAEDPDPTQTEPKAPVYQYPSDLPAEQLHMPWCKNYDHEAGQCPPRW